MQQCSHSLVPDAHWTKGGTQAEELVQQGKAVLVDSRAPWEFDKQHVAGAISVPLFLDVAGKSFWDNLKKFVVRFGMNMRATGKHHMAHLHQWACK